MTADQRLDQFEPLVSQTLAVADRHTAQLKQIYGTLGQHSDSLQFILEEMVEIKQDVGGLKQGMVALQEATNARLDVVDANISGLGTNLGGLNTKLDRILGLLDTGKE